MKDISKWNIMRDMQVKSMKAGFTCILLNKRKDIFIKNMKKEELFQWKTWKSGQYSLIKRDYVVAIDMQCFLQCYLLEAASKYAQSIFTAEPADDYSQIDR